ncbi:hypothetical protein [Lederbergia lenta]|uniref:hypothetical protein n=1 Tax=Lederbergia lenta TaxID=1467 RepID=UPI00204048AF|nr:hypothetical protein [Lederbergia lenta]MCM3109917.1 hypothetical protein [Lederbergia lenta]
MGEYFECEIRMEDETTVGTVWLRILPRIGEFMRVTYPETTYNFRITDVAHFVGDDKVGHRIQLYFSND